MGKRIGLRLSSVLALGLVALLSGCTSLYFQPASAAPESAPQHRLATWPDREYWWGLVFNGEKVGFSHLVLAPLAGAPDTYELRSEAAFALRFLGFDKRFHFTAYDVVRDDLELVRFRYAYSIDGSDIALAGERRGDTLEVTVRHAGEQRTLAVDVRGAIHPQAAIALYPTLHGLAPGREYVYRVYSGELQKIAEVTQRVGDYERSTLFDGDAYRLETQMEGYRVQTWINARGQPLLEIGMNGVLISGLESEQRAKRYLAAGSVNKVEALVAFALVRADKPLAEPRRIARLEIAVSGADRSLPSDSIQQCTRRGDETVCVITTDGGTRASVSASLDGADPRYLASTFPVPAADPAIAARARQIAGKVTEPREQVSLLLAWIGRNVRRTPADVFSALDVLDKREAECQGHTYLYAALARALGIPTRVVNGVVYSEDYDGFLYHTWAESFVGGKWLPVDPTFAMAPADATHVKLVEGETLAELAPLVDWIGRLQVRVIAATPR